MKGRAIHELLPPDQYLRFENLDSFVSLFGDEPRRLCEPRLLYMLVYIRQGTGWCRIDNEPVTLQQGTFFLVHPFAYIQFADTRFVYGNVVLFTEEYFCRTHLHESLLYRSAFEPQRKIIFQLRGRPEAFALLKNNFSTIGKEYRLGYESELKERLIVCLLYGSLLYLHKLQLEEEGNCYDLESSPAKDKVVDFIRLLNDHFKQEDKLEFYAAKMHVSLKMLGEICKKGFGMAPKAIMQAKVLAEAKRLLIFEQMSIDHISIELGFRERGSFNAFFSQHTGFKPKTYRQMNFLKVVEGLL